MRGVTSPSCLARVEAPVRGPEHGPFGRRASVVQCGEGFAGCQVALEELVEARIVDPGLPHSLV